MRGGQIAWAYEGSAWGTKRSRTIDWLRSIELRTIFPLSSSNQCRPVNNHSYGAPMWSIGVLMLHWVHKLSQNGYRLRFDQQVLSSNIITLEASYKNTKGRAKRFYLGLVLWMSSGVDWPGRPDDLRLGPFPVFRPTTVDLLVVDAALTHVQMSST